MKLVATIACRNNSRRLYGKPLQQLEERTVLAYIIDRIEECPEIDSVVLAISEEKGNEAFVDYARSNGISYVVGDDRDVLGRLISACDKVGGDTVFRVTSESPFCYLEALADAKAAHIAKRADYTTIAKLPDGSSFELISLSALKESHDKGDSRHRSELCTLYINENVEDFILNVIDPPESVRRPDYRLTIDFPEDLVLCRNIVRKFGGDLKKIPLEAIIRYLDDSPELCALVDNLADSNYIKPYY